MKTLIFILLLALAGCQETNIIQPAAETDAKAQTESVTLTIANGQFNGDSTYSFEVYAKSSVPDLYVGNTTVALFVKNGFEFSSLRNPKLTYTNPKYTLNNLGYYPMYVDEYSEGKQPGIYLQIVHLQNHGEGSILNTTDEKIAVVSCDVKFCVFDINYNNPKTIFLKPNYERVQTGNNGILEGCQ